jgi:membrane-associated phospholipid phosphatase
LPAHKKTNILQKIFLSGLLMLCFASATGQNNRDDQVYKFDYRWELPATVAGYLLDVYGLSVLKDKPGLDSLTILNLDRTQLRKFDRWPAYQNAENYESAQLISDIGMNITLFLPAILALDDKIRKDWLDVLMIYLETQAIGANLYLWAGPLSNNRIRPFVYNPGYDWAMKLGRGTRDSFFSGHTLWTAGASFFMAKVYSDYHPELGNRKYWYFAAAAIPPVVVGYFRARAGKHFPTDIFTGLALGAATGILVPHFHKQDRKKNYAITPFFGNYNGVAFSMKIGGKDNLPGFSGSGRLNP